MASRFIPKITPEDLAATQDEGLCWTVSHAYANSPFYRQRLKDVGVDPAAIRGVHDITSLPFTTANDLKEGYPFPLLSVPEEKVVRIHASSGTTGKRKVLTYTQRDIDVWKNMFARCYELAGCTTTDRVQICVGYGLWTAGAGFQLGCEHFGAMAVPIGPGLLDIQVQLLCDLKPTVLCSTASMALLMAEEVEKRGLTDQIALKRVIFGAEAHTPRMRQRFEELLHLESSHDISGMTEIYGPGAGIECTAHAGIHYWADRYIVEILDPETLAPVSPGEVGELVVTTLCKEASPLIRYRTRDLTRLLPGPCECGCSMPRHDKILGTLRRHDHRARGEHLSRPDRRSAARLQGAFQRIPDTPLPQTGPRPHAGLRGKGKGRLRRHGPEPRPGRGRNHAEASARPGQCPHRGPRRPAAHLCQDKAGHRRAEPGIADQQSMHARGLETSPCMRRMERII